MSQTPILILSDSPNLTTGLGRITRDVATILASLPEYRVGTLGRGGITNRKLPWPQYNFPEAGGGWGENVIEAVWRNFSDGKNGVIFTIWDATRLLWFSKSYPEMGPVHDFLTSKKFAKWGYFPIDSTGPGDRLTTTASAAIANFDKVIAYSMWGEKVIERSIGRRCDDWLPHGYDSNVFKPRDKAASRMAFGVGTDDLMIGCVMTNQTRKDWGLAFSTICSLRLENPNVKFFIVTDVMERPHAWSMYSLVNDFGLNDCVNLLLRQ